MILDDKEKGEVDNYIWEQIELLGQQSPDMLGIPKQISKPIHTYLVKSIHIRGAEYSNNFLDTNFKEGDKPMYIFVKKCPPKFPKTDVLCFEDNKLLEGFEIDYDRLSETFIKTKVHKIYGSMGWITNFDKEQSNISEWIKGD